MRTSLGLRAAAALLMVVLWEAASRSGLFYRGVLPPLTSIAAALADLLAMPGFWMNTGVTAFEVLCALLIGGTLGVACGVLVGGGGCCAVPMNRRCTTSRQRRRSCSCRS